MTRIGFLCPLLVLAACGGGTNVSGSADGRSASYGSSAYGVRVTSLHNGQTRLDILLALGESDACTDPHSTLTLDPNSSSRPSDPLFVGRHLAAGQVVGWGLEWTLVGTATVTSEDVTLPAEPDWSFDPVTGEISGQMTLSVFRGAKVGELSGPYRARHCKAMDQRYTE